MTFGRKLVGAVMTPLVCQCGSGESALDALAMMQRKYVSSVVIIDDAKVVGIITERDVVRALHRRGNLEGLRCADLMQGPVITVTATTRCLEAYHLMVSRGIRHLGITNEAGQVVGIASEGDLMRNFGNEYYMTFKDVGGVMSTQFCKLSPQATVASALVLMLDNQQSCVVVVNPKGHPVGVLTERDIVRLCGSHGNAQELALGEVMHSPVRTVSPRERLHQAVVSMEEPHIRRLVVVDDHDIVCGLLTHHEIARGLEGDYVAYLREVVDLQARNLQQAADAVDEKLLLANILREVTGTAVLASDLEYRISYATPAIDEVLGICLSDVGGADLRETMQGAGWNGVASALEEVARAKQPRNYTIQTRRGATDVKLSLLLNSQDRPQGYLVLGQKA
jgi:CBS domain-containing protein